MILASRTPAYKIFFIMLNTYEHGISFVMVINFKMTIIVDILQFITKTK